ncbi:ribose transport system permease protein [Orenia metallireducens]|jgi:ribose transport system permease protein|uniref:Ribose transport system permease protein n=1 Tax=Orenia metallireducens TaxID=1413210 RepID=A0A285IHP7_9FIRM|nr:ABC transporter permease [Orenia metallireducens]PRX17480.1 ribose transport system permease protein [Orenia metallireducens]SNY47495.1 ribose transport system permease protein [Orenia metallireducens]
MEINAKAEGGSKMKKESNILKRFLEIEESTILLALLILSGVISILTPKFLSSYNLLSIARQMSLVAIVAVGQTLVIITAGIDLSVGSIIGFTGIATTMLMAAGIPVFIAIILGLAVGALLGYINGTLITKIDIPPFIVTLGMLSIARGFIMVLTQGWPISEVPDSFTFLGQGYILGIPVPVIIMVAIMILGHIFLNSTNLGRYIYAIGGNEEAAELSGLNVKKIKTLVYTITGFLAGVSGIIMASRLSSGQPNAGDGWELDTIAAVVIGGTSLMGGEGTIFGTFLGAAIMAVLRNGLVLLNVSVYWQTIAIGAIVIGAVAMDRIRQKRKLKAN